MHLQRQICSSDDFLVLATADDDFGDPFLSSSAEDSGRIRVYSSADATSDRLQSSFERPFGLVHRFESSFDLCAGMSSLPPLALSSTPGAHGVIAFCSTDERVHFVDVIHGREVALTRELGEWTRSTTWMKGRSCDVIAAVGDFQFCQVWRLRDGFELERLTKISCEKSCGFVESISDSHLVIPSRFGVHRSGVKLDGWDIEKNVAVFSEKISSPSWVGGMNQLEFHEEIGLIGFSSFSGCLGFLDARTHRQNDCLIDNVSAFFFRKKACGRMVVVVFKRPKGGHGGHALGLDLRKLDPLHPVTRWNLPCFVSRAIEMDEHFCASFSSESTLDIFSENGATVQRDVICGEMCLGLCYVPREADAAGEAVEEILSFLRSFPFWNSVSIGIDQLILRVQPCLLLKLVHDQ